jgi:aminoglycoside phosphotransferase (APT) family kinase protein
MPAPHERDPEETRRQLAAWFERRLGAIDVRLSELRGPGASGFSSDTLLFDATWTARGESRSEALVVRLRPRGFGIFPEYDIAKQFRIQKALAPAGVPLAPMLWLEEDEGFVGAPFYVMGQVAGRIPPDNPIYHAGGWLTELRPQQRAALWWSGLDALAKIHRADWRALGLEFAARHEPGATPLERELAYYRRYLEWTRFGPHPICEQALDWLEKSRPKDEPTVLCWGDSRIGNMIFDQDECRAVLDWEMAALASPELDLGWWIFMDRHHSEGIGLPRLEGLPGRAETVARYEELTGHAVRHLEYYETFAALRFAAIMIRVTQQMKHYGLMPLESDFETSNTAARLLARMLDLPSAVPAE